MIVVHLWLTHVSQQVEPHATQPRFDGARDVEAPFVVVADREPDAGVRPNS